MILRVFSEEKRYEKTPKIISQNMEGLGGAQTLMHASLSGTHCLSVAPRDMCQGFSVPLA